MDIEGKVWDLSEKWGDYLLCKAEKMRRMIDEGPDGLVEFKEFVDTDAEFMEGIQKEMEAIVEEARKEERSKLLKATLGSTN